VMSDPAAPVPPAAGKTPAPLDRTAPAGASDPVTLQFPNSDVADVLRFYEQLTGKKLVMDNFVQGKVNIFIAKAVSRDEAIKISEPLGDAECRRHSAARQRDWTT